MNKVKPHDLNLPQWGPYSKQYMGVSHIANDERGMRFDLAVCPGVYRRALSIPNVTWESGFHPWEAMPDLSYYTMRYELEWKDQVYADITCVQKDASSRLLRCHFVNASGMDTNVVLHAMASMHYADSATYDVEPVVGENAVWVDALDYTDLHYESPTPQDNLVYDALRRGEEKVPGFTRGSGLGHHFGASGLDRVAYAPKVARPGHYSLSIRYRSQGKPVGLRIVCGGKTEDVTLPATGDCAQVASFALGALGGGTCRMEIQAAGPILLDGFGLHSTADAMQFAEIPRMREPELLQVDNATKTMLIKYRDAACYYGLRWEYPLYEVREILNDELDSFLRHHVHNHISSTLEGNRKGHYANLFCRPIPLRQNAEQVLHLYAASGEDPEAVKRSLLVFDFGAGETLYENARAQYEARHLAPKQGDPYAFGIRLMETTLLTNVVYPIYMNRSYIKHNTPGRWWDSLYTWDSGFIGIGLAEIDTVRSIECLKAYLTEPGDVEKAFIHHGSMVPVQFYQFQVLLGKTGSRTLAEYCYPRLRQYYLFFTGQLGSSATAKMQSGLLSTWAYFYNSGGWDDYPPQQYVHKHGLADCVTPVVTTAHAIRIAKMMALTARYLGIDDDYTPDIERFSQALQDHAWDADSGYFGYVVHDKAGLPMGILRSEAGENHNMGLDGALPLVAGTATDIQRSALMKNLQESGRLWSELGLSAVDQGASYFQCDGYWNGSVWMPYQWIYWKAMLGLGETDFAWKIACTALELWKRETEASYLCFEHFIIEGAHGAGWHQFGGLSAPVVSWYAAYYVLGTISTGYDLLITKYDFDDDFAALDMAFLCTQEALDSAIIVVLKPSEAFQVCVNNQPVPFEERMPGVIELKLRDCVDISASNHLSIRSQSAAGTA